ncbi:Protein of unknown function [Cnuella takakiae]|uniref:YhcG N-terminal domain-containing protein n=1 Tax=Cnuella takakiae TaxID=1302690 RepID=A0A1M4TLF3_9BACT|nr:Protein of unknown function [Cnuella takakiae]
MNPEYKSWLADLKSRIQAAQVKAALKVNAELIALYWELAAEILEKEKHAAWGEGWLQKLSNDLMNAFTDVKGFSLTNLKYIRRWFLFYQNPIGQQLVAQLQAIDGQYYTGVQQAT